MKHEEVVQEAMWNVESTIAHTNCRRSRPRSHHFFTSTNLTETFPTQNDHKAPLLFLILLLLKERLTGRDKLLSPTITDLSRRKLSASRHIPIKFITPPHFPSIHNPCRDSHTITPFMSFTILPPFFTSYTRFLRSSSLEILRIIFLLQGLRVFFLFFQTPLFQPRILSLLFYYLFI